jgi:hypothetical protein
MKKKVYRKYLTAFFLLLFILTIYSDSVSAEKNSDDTIYVEYYYSEICNSCMEKKENIVELIEQKYDNTSNIVFVYKKTSEYQNEYEFYQKKYNIDYPFIILKNQTNESFLKESDITISKLSKNIDLFLRGVTPKGSDPDVVEFNFLFWDINFDTDDFSLPVLTVVLAGVDSFNPCAFFILIILLGLLVHAKNRKRMLLIGGIFIFFSGFLYALFMFVLFNVFYLTRESITVITIIAGLLALSLGVLDIKDFFFFKKGVSISIPDEKKPDIYKKMRDLVKNPRLAAVVFGTVVLAGTVNFYELLCTLGLPLVFTQKLSTYDLSGFEYYIYIVFYNVVYVIPLIVIVLIFVYTLGRVTLTEWHGRLLKLFAGIMLSGFGLMMLIDYQLLSNVVTPVILLLISIISTFLVSFIWKKFKLGEQS